MSKMVRSYLNDNYACTYYTVSVKVCGNTVAYQQLQLLLITEAVMLIYIVLLILMVVKYDTACVVLPIWLITLFMTSNEVHSSLAAAVYSLEVVV